MGWTQRQGRIVDRGGRFFAYHVYHSIDLPEWPANRDPGFTRAFISMCYLYSPSAADPSSAEDPPAATVDCFILGRFHPGGSVPPALGAFVAAERMLSVANAVVCAQAKRFSRLAARAADRCVPSASLHHCDLCAAPSSSASAPSTVECAGCRRRACRRCHTLRPVFRLHPRTKRPEKDVFCRECVDLVARASAGVGGFRRGRHKGGPPEDAGGTGDECSGSSSSGHEDPAAVRSRPQPHQRPRSSSEDAAPFAADPRDQPTRQRAGTDGRGPRPHVEPDADADAGQRTARSHSLLFDPERQLYIRVFDDRARPLPIQTPTPSGRTRADPHADVPTARPAARHDRSAEDAKAARVGRDIGRGRGQRDRVFSVDALD